MEIFNRKQVKLWTDYFARGEFIQVSINSDGHLVIREWSPEMIEEPYEKVSTCKNCGKQIIYNDQEVYWYHADKDTDCKRPEPSKVRYFDPEEYMIVLNKAETQALVNFVLKYVKEIKKEETK